MVLNAVDLAPQGRQVSRVNIPTFLVLYRTISPVILFETSQNYITDTVPHSLQVKLQDCLALIGRLYQAFLPSDLGHFFCHLNGNVLIRSKVYALDVQLFKSIVTSEPKYQGTSFTRVLNFRLI